jgi:hypothetical protein
MKKILDNKLFKWSHNIIGKFWFFFKILRDLINCYIRFKQKKKIKEKSKIL